MPHVLFVISLYVPPYLSASGIWVEVGGAMPVSKSFIQVCLIGGSGWADLAFLPPIHTMFKDKKALKFSAYDWMACIRKKLDPKEVRQGAIPTSGVLYELGGTSHSKRMHSIVREQAKPRLKRGR